MDTRSILFKTIHGSRLYGLHRPDSDYDYFTVVAKAPYRRKRYAKQSIIDGEDSVVVDLGTFIVGCQKGVPQYLEALFSPVPEVDKLGAMRYAYRTGSNQVWETYLRTIKALALDDTFKSKRHALRLASNLFHLREYGRFNPVLNETQVVVYSGFAQRDSGEDVYELAKMMAGIGD